MTRQAKFLQGDLLHHIVVMAMSASLGLLSIFVVDFVDLYFISLLGEVLMATWLVSVARPITIQFTSGLIGLRQYQCYKNIS